MLAEKSRQDFIMKFRCGCFIVNNAESNYREYNRFVCAHHQFHEIAESERDQRSVNLDILATALNPGQTIMSEEEH